MNESIAAPDRKLGTRCCTPDTQTLDIATAQVLANNMQILGHPIRLQLLELLARSEGQVCVCDLESTVPVKQPTVSHHLRLLREAGLIDCEKHGLWVYYSIRRDAVSALRGRIVAQLGAFA
ncbi:MAG: metalloregulator ArsR/SmtB family transcription factor [Chloroflexota bacterium]|nr:metalloregulator ArsR/SmtB family transcription factor [Chloroflexota bacterium]